MAPNSKLVAEPVVLNGAQDIAENVEVLKKPYKMKILWINTMHFIILHALALYGGFLSFTSAKVLTGILAYILWLFSITGITVGAHRLWSHRAYKVNLPLKLLLVAFNTLAWQDSIIHWARDHRVHHKYTETNADPYSAARGFFFSHMGWLMCVKHPDVREKGQTIDISDLKADPVLRFQHKYYLYLMPVACFLLPTLIPWYFWGESLLNGFLVCGVFRYVIGLHCTWLINSAAHLFGNKPYDKSIYAAHNSKLSIFTFGESFHNFHHVFPWDYRTGEFGNYFFNFHNFIVDFFAKIGWAYDLKSVSGEVIEQRTRRTGDGSHPIWGWGDEDQDPNEREFAIIYNKEKY